jgi:hypothetical protein
MLTTQQHDRRVRREARFLLESLDDRLLLSAGARGAAAESVVDYQAANNTRLYDQSRRRDALEHGSRHALPANVSAPLRSLYREYEVRGGGSSLSMRGVRVAVRIKVAFPPALGGYLRGLRADGLQIVRTMRAFGMVEGWLPLAKLPAVARVAAHVWPAAPSIES